MKIKRGNIVIVRLEPVKGSEQGGTRPCLIIQNDDGNKYSPLTIAAPITSKKFTKSYPTNVFLNKNNSKLDKDSTVMLNQIRTIDKSRILKQISNLNYLIMKEVDIAIKVSLGLN
ncbi:PemK family transcriptional regulator [Candidatus Pacearchaeota archaeon CG10_big_fil_rev_8_21_14_0_10_31_24]|nr:MAG: PemK family transcriptional regulator [Candidatus Pacearchaeota archaeon CG10_big_fil_rev_8_21_14_0_10_31_24]